MNNTAPATQPDPTAPTAEDKTTAIVAYLTLIGFIVAIILHGQKKTRLGAYHLRQSLGLMLTSIAVMIAATIIAFIPFVGWLAGMAAWVGIIALWVIGLISAVNGQMKPIPVVGPLFEQWFGRAFE